jgi:predicted DNA-binding transcriptional regulator YafY
MLQDMGIPVEAERGPHGAYQLKRGHRIPPLMFTEPEAIALTLGLLAIREFRFPVDVAALESALAKAERVMPEKLLSQARALQETIAFHTDVPPARVQNDSVTMLSSAAQRRQQVHMRYRSWGGEESERQFDPYGLVFNEGYWYTAGYCHLRRDVRTFRLDRILTLEPLPHTFDRPENFDVLGFVLTSLFSRQGTEQVEVLMKATLEQVQQVVSPDIGTLEETQQGVIFRRAALHLEWVAFFLMCLDFPMVVLKPDTLRETLRQMATNALKMTGDNAEL